MGKLTKTELIKALAKQTSLTNAEAGNVLDQLGGIVQAQLAEGNDVTLGDIGILKPKRREARTGRNPRTGESVEIAAKTAVGFKASKGLIDGVNA